MQTILPLAVKLTALLAMPTLQSPNHPTLDVMAVLTIRNLDEKTKQALRVRAARHGVSMEQEARLILTKEVISNDRGASQPAGQNWYRSIRELVEPYGGFDLEIPSRSKQMRDPPKFE